MSRTFPHATARRTVIADVSYPELFLSLKSYTRWKQFGQIDPRLSGLAISRGGNSCSGGATPTKGARRLPVKPSAEGPSVSGRIRDLGLGLLRLNQDALVALAILKPRRSTVGAEEQTFVRVFQPL